MASSILLRRQLAPVSMAGRRFISAIVYTSLNKPLSTLTPVSNPVKTVDFGTNHRNVGVSAFRSQSRLCISAPFGSQAAGFAMADYSDEEKGKFGGESDTGLEISKLNIDEEIISCLVQKGITKLFPIQKAVLEPAMQGRDMIGRAKTGTGKTLAFGIPILDKITRHNKQHGAGRDPLALVLAPTRELAKQVEKEFQESSRLDTLCVYGGSPISRQMSVLNQGVDVVAGTPGRVIDLIKRGALNLSCVQFLVLDEADQMLNVGFAEAVEVILEKLPRKRQTMMFSATMPNWILQLTRKHLKDPLTIDLVGDSDQKLAEGIALHSFVADRRTKAGVIGPLFTEYGKGGKCIVFTPTKRDADSLANAMGRKNYRCEPLHGDIAQNQRERTLQRFRDGHINILVATDVAARGLDIPNVDLVIHYELPSTSEIFVHRSGRTGRAGKTGTAILIHSMDDSRAVRVIERDVGCRFKELPAVASDGTEMEMSGGFGGSRFGGAGRFGLGSGSNDFGRSGGYAGMRSGGYGESGSGRFGSYGGSQRSGSGGYGGSSEGGLGRSRFGRPSDGYGRSGASDRSSGFGDFGSSRQSGFGDFSLSQSSSSFGGGRSNQFGSFGNDRS